MILRSSRQRSFRRCNFPQQDAAGSPATCQPVPPPSIELDTAQLDQIIGVKGSNNGGVYQFAVRRRDPFLKESDMMLTPPGPMGVATAIGFQPTGDGKAAITGDFVLRRAMRSILLSRHCVNGRN